MLGLDLPWAHYRYEYPLPTHTAIRDRRATPVLPWGASAELACIPPFSALFLHTIPQPLLIREQRRPLAILADNLSSREGITTQQSRHAHSKRKHEQQAADRKGKDPLQL